MKALSCLLLPLAATAFASLGQAASLRVSPVLVDLAEPAAASSIKVWNDTAQPVSVQVRIFRWTQEGGNDVLVPTQDVAVSPPLAALKPEGQNLVRIVRLSKRPVAGEESYRLVVDQLPPASRGNATVTMVVRHSIPVFFASRSRSAADVSWTVSSVSGGYRISATNRGGTRFRLANLSLDSGKGIVARKTGLIGYVLAGSTASWFVPGKSSSGASVTISGESENGIFHEKTRLAKG